MREEDEPAENIAGGAPRRGALDAPDGSPSTRAEAVVDRLGTLYWRTQYGGMPAVACLVRTVLSQNTSDVASQPAYDRLMARYDAADDLAAALAATDRTDIASAIASAGLHNRKSRVIQRLARDVIEEWGSTAAFDAFVRESPAEVVRERLLAFDGVGPKTADCVLLFAAGRDGVFPVDTHVHRVARRLGLAPPHADHQAVRKRLEADVPPAKCGFGHTTMIQFGREYCPAGAPACLDGPSACPLYGLCDRVGVDTAAGVAVDPAEVVDG
ncbi:MAG: endonuclease III domain-containing protein [Halobacteriales archaeon]